MSNLVHTIELVVGDWSFDGHEKTAQYSINSNLTATQVTAAYRAGEKKVGLEFSKRVAAEYQDARLMGQEARILREGGVDLRIVDFDEEYEEIGGGYSGDEGEDDETVAYLDADSYVDIWLQIAKIGNPKFEYKMFEGESINIGGYGLF